MDVNIYRSSLERERERESPSRNIIKLYYVLGRWLGFDFDNLNDIVQIPLET